MADGDLAAAFAAETLIRRAVLVGIVQLITGVLILQRNPWGLWLGVAIAGLSAMLTVLVMFVFPLWATAVLAIDLLVLYGLLTRGDEFTA